MKEWQQLKSLVSATHRYIAQDLPAEKSASVTLSMEQPAVARWETIILFFWHWGTVWICWMNLPFIGRCLYASSKWRIELFLNNNSMCDDLNRHKILCSNCKEGYGVAIYSGSWYCSPCTLGGYAWLLYIALETVPVTVFFLAVVFFNVRATSPPMTGFILFNQILVTFLRNQIILVPLLKTFPNGKYILSIGLTLSGIWNLDFFRDIIPHFCGTYHLTNFGMIAFCNLSLSATSGTGSLHQTVQSRHQTLRVLLETGNCSILGKMPTSCFLSWCYGNIYTPILLQHCINCSLLFPVAV